MEPSRLRRFSNQSLICLMDKPLACHMICFSFQSGYGPRSVCSCSLHHLNKMTTCSAGSGRKPLLSGVSISFALAEPLGLQCLLLKFVNQYSICTTDSASPISCLMAHFCCSLGYGPSGSSTCQSNHDFMTFAQCFLDPTMSASPGTSRWS